MPVFYPIMNDKITMRVWHKRYGLNANMYIANVPEHPQAGDNFNISKLLTLDGGMKTRWINLYGTHPKERSSRTKGLREGTSYLGRVLINFRIVTTDRPQLTSQVTNKLREPKRGCFQLWVDVFELVDCDFATEYDKVHLEYTIGSNKSTEP